MGGAGTVRDAVTRQGASAARGRPLATPLCHARFLTHRPLRWKTRAMGSQAGILPRCAAAATRPRPSKPLQAPSPKHLRVGLVELVRAKGRYVGLDAARAQRDHRQGACGQQAGTQASSATTRRQAPVRVGRGGGAQSSDPAAPLGLPGAGR